MPRLTERERFERKFEVREDGCWQWIAALNWDGYGNFGSKLSGRAHRWAYITYVGPIPPGLTIDHLCRNRACVNPEHMEIVTQRENTLRGDTVAAKNARKTHCMRGHPFDAENTMFVQGGRRCRECSRVHRRRSDARRRAKVNA